MSINETASLIHIKELGLSRRLENLLIRRRIYTLAQLIEFLANGEVLQAKGIGPAALQELQQLQLMDHLTKDRVERDESKGTTLPNFIGETKIETLPFSVRVRNALLRTDITTVAQLMEYQQSGNLLSVWNLGEKGIAEILNYLDELSDLAVKQPPSADSPVEVGIEQSTLVERLAEKVRIGQLHPRARIKGLTLAEISEDIPSLGFHIRAIEVALNFKCVDDEVEEILSRYAKEDQILIVRRFGFSKKTLQEVGDMLGVSRERVRQREEKILRQFPTLFENSSYVHIQSALLLGEELVSRGEFSANSWEVELQKVGLLSAGPISLASEEFRTIELLVALNELGIKREDHLPVRFLKDLSKAFEAPDLSVEMIFDLERYKQEFTRDIDRIIRIAGAISVKHAPVYISIGYKDIHSLLQHLGYGQLSGEWYSKNLLQPDRSFSHQAALVNNVLLILKCVTEINISELRVGLQRGAERHKMTIAPAWVLAKVLRLNGFQVHNDKVTWPFENKIELRGRRQILFRLFQEAGPVVSNTKIIHAFERAGQSEAAAILAMQYSPLIQRVERSLYKFIGSKVLDKDIHLVGMNKNAVERIPLAKEQSKDGLSVVFVEAGSWIKKGVLPINTTLQLQGAWKAICEGEVVCTILNKNGTIKPLSSVLERLHISLGDQIQLAFDPKRRYITFSKG